MAARQAADSSLGLPVLPELPVLLAATAPPAGLATTGLLAPEHFLETIPEPPPPSLGQDRPGRTMGHARASRPKGRPATVATTSAAQPQPPPSAVTVAAPLSRTYTYLRSSRHTKLAVQTGEWRPMVAASPAEIRFSDFSVGQTYTEKLTLINTGSTSTQLRVVPPSTKFFTLSPLQYPQTGSSVVSPGLACTAVISFTPDTLFDFADEVVIQPCHGPELVVSLLACRGRPELGLPANWSCPPCRVGQSVQLVLECTNVTGAETHATWSAQSPGSPFTVEPLTFLLLAGGRQPVSVLFSPRQPGHFAQNIRLLLDNGDTHDYGLVGEAYMPQLSVLGLDACGPSQNGSAQYTLTFPPTNPGIPQTHSFRISNDTDCTLPVRWSRPEEIPFTIDPPTASLAARTFTVFTVSSQFTQPIRRWDTAHLCLDDGEAATLMSVRLAAEVWPHRVAPAASSRLLQFPGLLTVNTPAYHSFCLESQSLVPVAYSCATITTPRYRIEMLPAAGTLSAGQTQIQQALLQVRVTGYAPGVIHETLMVCIVGMSSTLAVPVYAQVATPQVVIDQPTVDFGVLRTGALATSHLTLQNKDPMPAAWRLVASGYLCGGHVSFHPSAGQLAALDSETVRVMLHSSDMPPASTHLLNFHLVLHANGAASTTAVAAHAVIQASMAVFEQPIIDLRHICVGTHTTVVARLCNLTSLPTKFRLCHQPELPLLGVFMSPTSGILAPKEILDVHVEVQAQQLGAVCRQLYAFEVEGMSRLVPLAISALVCPPYLLVSVDEQVQETVVEPVPVMDFGTLPVHQPCTRQLVLRNPSAVTMRLQLQVMAFAPTCGTGHGAAKTGDSTPPSLQVTMLQTTISRASGTIFGRTTDGTSVGTAHWNGSSAAPTAQGAVVTLDSNSVTLGPQTSVTVAVTWLSDMWGTFEDQVVCRGDLLLTPVTIPLRARVIGCPLRLSVDRVCFSARAPSDAEPALRTLRVRNPSPYDLRVRWTALIMAPESDQLLDCVVEIDVTGTVHARTRVHQGQICSRPFAIDADASTQVIPRRGKGQVVVVFHPEQLGLHRGLVVGHVELARLEQVTPVPEGGLADHQCWNQDLTAIQLQLHGTATAPYIGWDLPEEGLSFDPQTSAQRIEITNTTVAALKCEVVVSGPFALSKKHVGQLELELAAGKRRAITVTVQQDQPLEETNEIPLAGRLDLYCDGQVIKSAPLAISRRPTSTVSVVPSNMDFGSCCVGRSVERVVMLCNPGLAEVSWTARMTDGRVRCQPTQGILPAATVAHSVALTLVVTPDTKGPVAASIDILVSNEVAASVSLFAAVPDN